MSNCTGAWASAEDFATFWCLPALSEDERVTIESFLSVAASDVHAALGAVGACECNLASWATEYLKKLNIIDAAIWHNCPCGSAHITDAMRQSYIMWITEQFTGIRTQQIELCDGYTGSEYPAAAIAVRNWGTFSEAKILLNRQKRYG